VGFFRKNLSNDLVSIDPDNISNKDWVILLEAGTITGPSHSAFVWHAGCRKRRSSRNRRALRTAEPSNFPTWNFCFLGEKLPPPEVYFAPKGNVAGECIRL
jgi:hypothetical protein